MAVGDRLTTLPARDELQPRGTVAASVCFCQKLGRKQK